MSSQHVGLYLFSGGKRITGVGGNSYRSVFEVILTWTDVLKKNSDTHAHPVFGNGRHLLHLGLKSAAN